MANPLTASLIAEGKNANATLPGGTIRFQFSNRELTATDVTVEVLQARAPAPSSGDVRSIATFRGAVRNGTYVGASAEAHAINTAPSPNPLTPITVSDGSRAVRTNINDFERHQLFHLLRLRIRGRVKGTPAEFVGRADLHVDYPQVMIVPTPTAVLDKDLNVISSWSNYWRDYDSGPRHRIAIPTIRSPTPCRTSHYNDLVSAFGEATRVAPGGIIALAVGHSDAGDGVTDAWASVTAEDAKKHVDADGHPYYFYSLNIHQVDLVDGMGQGPATVGDDARVRLNCLDRIADVLGKASIRMRKLILHGCRAGENATFCRVLCDRIKIPLQAHRTEVIYEGHAGRRPIYAFYDKDDAKPRTPEQEHEWPSDRLCELYVPNVDLDHSHTDVHGNYPRRWDVPAGRK